MSSLERVQELFEAALQREAAEREAFLREACGEDGALQRRVMALLDADAQTEAVLDATICPPLPGMDDELAPGTVLDQYEVEARIGSGGYGSVYRARHRVIHKAAAIKVLHPEHAHSAALARRFITEARAVNEIGHPNIIDIFAFGETDDGRLYYIMEYVDAPSLEEVLRARGRLGLPAALPILRGLAAALDAAHAVGIVHRDLKPANVIVREDDSGNFVPKLLDFGVAKLAHGDASAIERTDSGQIIGTPAYMAPEQIRGKPVDARTDVYAFGVLTYRLLTGSPPLSGDSPFDVLVAHTQETPRPPSELVPALGPETDAAVLAMLAKDPDARPATLADAIAPLLAAAPQSGAAAAASSPWIARGLAAAAVVAVAVVGWQVSQRPDRKAPAPVVEAPAAPAEAAPAAVPVDVPAPVVTAEVNVTVEIEGAPPGTTVIGPDERVLGTTPDAIVLPAGSAPLTLTFERPDGRRQSRPVVPDRDQAIELDWSTPGKGGGKGKRRLHPDLETPFPK